MEELLLPGVTTGWVVPATRDGRKTQFDLVSVRHGRELVSVDSRMANRLVARVLAAPGHGGFGPGPWKAEVGWGSHRFDFARIDPRSGEPSALLEIKSSNLTVGRTAMFPDAPTLRGASHLRALARARGAGIRATVLFVVQHSLAHEFAPNRVLDPEFARAFDRAHRAGVVLRARTVHVGPGRVRWGREIPVRARPSPELIKWGGGIDGR